MCTFTLIYAGTRARVHVRVCACAALLSLCYALTLRLIRLCSGDEDQVSEQSICDISGNAELNSTSWISNHSGASLYRFFESESWDLSMERQGRRDMHGRPRVSS